MKQQQPSYEVWSPYDSWGDGFLPFIISTHRAAIQAQQLVEEWGEGDADERPTKNMESYLDAATDDELAELDFASGRARRAAFRYLQQYHPGRQTLLHA